MGGMTVKELQEAKGKRTIAIASPRDQELRQTVPQPTKVFELYRRLIK